jgi:hypothetical protein
LRTALQKGLLNAAGNICPTRTDASWIPQESPAADSGASIGNDPGIGEEEKGSARRARLKSAKRPPKTPQRSFTSNPKVIVFALAVNDFVTVDSCTFSKLLLHNPLSLIATSAFRPIEGRATLASAQWE